MAQFTMSPACSDNRQYKTSFFCRRRRTGRCHFLRQVQKACLISVALSALFSVPLNAQPLPYSRKKLLLVFQTRLANGSILRLRCRERALARRLSINEEKSSASLVFALGTIHAPSVRPLMPALCSHKFHRARLRAGRYSH